MKSQNEIFTNITLVSSNRSDKIFVYDDIAEILMLWNPYKNEIVAKNTLKGVKSIEYTANDDLVYVLAGA